MTEQYRVELLTLEQVEQILLSSESHFLDFKAKEIAPNKITKHISAFANSDGGELFIGIKEDKSLSAEKSIWDGFKTIEEANGCIQGLFDKYPLANFISYSFYQHPTNNTFVFHIQVFKTTEIITDSSGKTYIRRSAQSLPLSTADELEKLKYSKGITSFETQLVTQAAKDSVTNSESIIKFMLEAIPTQEPEVFLRKQHLLVNDTPKVAAILLFADEPQALLPKRCGVKIYRYRTSKEGVRDVLDFTPITIEGCLYDQIKESVEKTLQIISDMTLMENGVIKHIEYPKETLHEIITNAVIHRDYSITDDIHVRIFNNRIEVESPGKLPGHITVKNILAERYSRNPTIVRVINKFPDPPNKDVGEGLNTAFEAMKKLKLKVPDIREKEMSVIVDIKHESIAAPEQLVLDYLSKNSEIRNSIAREICYIPSENAMKRVFEKLIADDLIERVPGKKGKISAYRITEKGKQTVRDREKAAESSS